MLRAFSVAAIKEKSIDAKVKKKEIEKFTNGINWPKSELVNHGQYLSNYASELHYAIEEGSINILSVAHELYLLEVITKLS